MTEGGLEVIPNVKGEIRINATSIIDGQQLHDALDTTDDIGDLLTPFATSWEIYADNIDAKEDGEEIFNATPFPTLWGGCESEKEKTDPQPQCTEVQNYDVKIESDTPSDFVDASTA